MASSPAFGAPFVRAEFRSRSAAFFDLDRTMVVGSSMFPLALALRRAGMLRLQDLFSFTAAQGAYRLARREAKRNIDRACSVSLRTIAGRSREELLRIADDVVHRTLNGRLFEEAVTQIERHLRAGDLVIICTSSSEDLAGLLARHLGADGALGTRAEVVDGRFTGALEDGLNHGPRKAERVRAFAESAGIDLARSTVYTDSINDLPLLLLAGRPVAVNPDRALRSEADARGWGVFAWRRRIGATPGSCGCEPVARRELSGYPQVS